MIEKRLLTSILLVAELSSAQIPAENSRIARLIDGITMSHKDDDARLTRAAAVFDDLYEYFRRKARG